MSPERESEVREAVERILNSPGFSSKRRGELLRYLVERALAGEAESVTEYGIALDVFRKPESFDPRKESTIRAEMSRLRKTLAEYYQNAGAGEAWRLEFPSGGYTPSFVHANSAERDPRATRTTAFRSRAWAWTAAFVLLGLGVLGFWKWGRGTPAVHSVVVLPFVNLTGDPGNDYRADGFTEGLTDTLARVASLRVVARTSAFQFKGKPADIREIGRRVGAEAVVEGSLRKTNGRLLVTVQVNRAADGYHILSRDFEGTDDARIQEEMSAPILAALRVGGRQAPSRTPDGEAFDLVLRARALRGYGAQDKFNKAVGLLNQAIQKDPQYGGAYAELASQYATAAGDTFVDPLGAAADARAAAERAIQLDPASATAYAAEGFVDAMVLGHWMQGEQELRSALRLVPQDAAIHQRLGLVLLVQGRFSEALNEVRTAAELDPLVPAAGSSIGMVYFMERRYAEALAEWRKLAALHPDAVALRGLVGMALEAQGNYAGAEKEYDASASLDPVDADLRRMHLFAVSGRRREAERLLDKYGNAAPGGGLDFAATYGALGERDRAFEWLNRTCQNRSCWMLKVHPFLDPLRTDPRYAAFLKRAGFE